MKPLIKKILLGVGAVIVVAALGLGVFVWTQTSAFDASTDKIYSIPIETVEATITEENIARGDHLAHSLGGCALADCHGANLAGGREIPMGPIGNIVAPNITMGGLGAVYSDGEIMRVVEHGVRKDGRTVVFMGAHEINWLPKQDILAVISYVRSMPPVNNPAGKREIGVLGKVLDRQEKLPLDIARRIDHDHIEKGPPPSPTAEYGRYIAKLCMGCHGETYSGGPIPGAPPDLPIPANITPHPSGLPNYSYEQFEKLADQGLRHDGQKVDPFMPIEVLSNMDQTERKALFAFLTSLPQKPYGNR